jgi:hypothetical protein
MAMTQAEEVAATLRPGQLTLSPWSFPEERMTIFRLSVALAIHDPQRALQAAIATPADWRSGPHVPAAWAQIRVGAGIAQLLQDERDGDEITGRELQQMAAAASRQLAATPPITVTLGKVVYHPEAIMLAARPRDALIPVLEAARSATYKVTGQYGQPGNQSPWTPHITVSYSTARQPAEPIISALGHELPGCLVQISAVNLVIQRGPERHWDWNPVATVRFGAAHATSRLDQVPD